MNAMEYKALIRQNPLYRSCRKTADRLLWLCGRNFCGKATSLPYDDALRIVESRRPQPDSPQQTPRTRYNEGILDLSIIVPVYNTEAYVDECIRSVLDQQHAYQVELILIDDGSTDRSCEILDTYASHPGVMVIHKKNGGLSSARNEGLKHASGNYIMFLDSDDYLGNNCIARMLDKAYQEDCDIVQMQYVRFSGNVRTPTECHWTVSSTEDYGEKCALPGHAWIKLFRSRLFEGLFFPEGYWYEDTIVHMILFERSGRLGTIADIGYFYRMNASGITYSKKKNNRCLEAYWIMPAVMNMRQALGMPLTAGAYLQLMKHLSILLYHRTKGVDEQTREALFVLSAELVRKTGDGLGQREIPMTKDEKRLEQAFRSRDYGLWKWYCRCHSI